MEFFSNIFQSKDFLYRLNTILLEKTTTYHGAIFEYINLVKFALTTIYNQNNLGW